MEDHQNLMGVFTRMWGMKSRLKESILVKESRDAASLRANKKNSSGTVTKPVRLAGLKYLSTWRKPGKGQHALLAFPLVSECCNISYRPLL